MAAACLCSSGLQRQPAALGRALLLLLLSRIINVRGKGAGALLLALLQRLRLQGVGRHASRVRRPPWDRLCKQELKQTISGQQHMQVLAVLTCSWMLAHRRCMAPAAAGSPASRGTWNSRHRQGLTSAAREEAREAQRVVRSMCQCLQGAWLH